MKGCCLRHETLGIPLAASPDSTTGVKPVDTGIRAPSLWHRWVAWPSVARLLERTTLDHEMPTAPRSLSWQIPNPRCIRGEVRERSSPQDDLSLLPREGRTLCPTIQPPMPPPGLRPMPGRLHPLPGLRPPPPRAESRTIRERRPQRRLIPCDRTRQRATPTGRAC